MNKRVLVVGVFNVLHPGHVRMLRFAKECGDVLTVAVLPDGKDNQSIHVDESLRLECILSNSYVDDAFIVHGDVNDLIERLRPDVLVKGREFEDKYNPEEEILNKYGGELVFDSGEVLFSSLDLLEKEFDGGSGIPGGMPYGYMKRQHIEPIKLLHHLNLISRLKVVVIGDLIVDEYITCDPLGMSREDPTVVVTPIDNQIFLGGAGIVAAHAAGLGAEVSFLTVAGDDQICQQALGMLREADVESYIVHDEHRPTTLKQRFRSKGKTLLRVSHLHQTDISKKLQEKLIEHLQGVIDDADLLVFSDFNYGCLPDELVCSICELAREKQLLIVADSQSSSQIGDISRYKNVDLLTPTEYEARIAMRDHNSGLVVLAETLRQKTESKNIIIKLGEEGVLIHASSDNDAGYATDRIAALNMSPKDVAGAGDSMLIVSAMALCVGGTIWESAVLGSLAASLQVGRLGNRPLNMDELSSMVII